MTTVALSPRTTSGARLVRRLRVASALGVSGAMFLFVGRWIMAGADPLGPISLLATANPTLAMVKMTALGIVASAIGTVIAGTRPGLMGSLAIAAGLATLSYPQAGLDYLPLALPSAASAWPVRLLIFETMLWVGLIAVGSVVGRWIGSWSAAGDDDEADASIAEPAVDSAAELTRGVLAACVAAAAGYLLALWFGGSAEAAVLKGQVYFSAFASMYLAGWVSCWFLRGPSPLWLLLSVAAVAMTAYVLGAPRVTGETVLLRTHLIIPPVARPLPIEFASVGALGAIIGALTVNDLIELDRRRAAASSSSR